jgi:aminopeptidase N
VCDPAACVDRRRLIIAVGASLSVVTVVVAATIAARDGPRSLSAGSTTTTTTTAASIGQAGASGVGDPYFPGAGNGGYDVDHYALDLSWDPLRQHLDGVTTISAVATQALASFSLDLIGLDVTAVEVDGDPARWERRGDHELVVKPARTLPEEATFRTVVAYNGTPVAIAGAEPIDPGFVTDGREVYVASEPDGAATFFPCNDHPTDKATYEIRVTVPEALDVAANGLLRETISDDGAGTETWVFEAPDPMATYLVQVVVANLRFQELTGPAGLPIRNAYDADLGDDVRVTFERQGEMIDFFDDLFGPYPFATYGAVVVDEDLGFALETQTLSLFGTNARGEPAVAHELAHQWFGDHVSLGSWRDIWLNEGFATYAQWLWAEHQGDGTVDEAAAAAAGIPGLDVPPDDPGAGDLFRSTVYLRGALTLHVLRHELGDDAFFELLRAWVDRYGGQSATTADFEALAEELAGRDLSVLFDAWLHSSGLPTLADWL